MFCSHKSFQDFFSSSFQVLLSKVNRFWVQLCYFIAISLVGFLALRVSKPRTASFKPKTFDLFFTSVSALTNSSMSTIEMEIFSTFQLIVMTILMLVGGEVFLSWLGLHISSKLHKTRSTVQKFSSNHNNIDLSSLKPTNFNDQIELGIVSSSSFKNDTTNISLEKDTKSSSTDDNLNQKSIRVLCYVVLGYLLVFHIAGTSFVSLYISLVPSAKEVMKNKGFQTFSFSVFTIVSTFSNCGFVPTNENMIVFKKNSGLLLLLIPQVLFGNTLYPVCLRILIWVLNKSTKRAEFEYILRNYKEIGYHHLFSGIHSSLLAVTVFVFIFAQFVLFCSLEWSSEATDGLNFHQKFVAILFQVINSRHTGESVFDLSIISSAILVLFVVMMYLPPYTSFLPTRYREKDSRNCKLRENEKKNYVESLIFSQLSYLVVCIILVCITEREKIKNDPLNFNVLNITIEVISAYGNVGFTTGYSCKRQFKAESSCKDTWFGFVGRWSNGG